MTVAELIGLLQDAPQSWTVDARCPDICPSADGTNRDLHVEGLFEVPVSRWDGDGWVTLILGDPS